MKRFALGLIFGLLSLAIFSLPQISSGFDLDPLGIVDGSCNICATSEGLPPAAPPLTTSISILYLTQQADQHCTPTIQDVADPKACQQQQTFCKDVYWKCLADSGCSAQGQVYTCPQGVYEICESWPYQNLLEPKCKEKTPDSIVGDAISYFCGDFKKLGLEECDEGPNGGPNCDGNCKKKLILLSPMVNINKLQLPNPNPISPTDPITPNDSDADTDKGDKNIDPDSADSKQGVILAKGEPSDVTYMYCSLHTTGTTTTRSQISLLLILLAGMLPLAGMKIRRVRRDR